MTISNKITICRILLIPIMIIVLFITPLNNIDVFLNMNLAELLFGILFIIGALSDILDGYLARKRNEITDLGKFLDPIADKLLTTTALLYIANSRTEYTWWWVLILVIISREFIVAAIRMAAASNNVVIAASVYGKIKTTLQMIAIIAILFNGLGLYHIMGDNAHYITDVLFYISVAATVYSGIDYLWKNKAAILKEEN